MSKAKLPHGLKPHKYKVGDILEAQGAQLKVTGLIYHEGEPAYKMRSPHTKGEPWLVGEWALSTCKKVRAKKGKDK